MAGTNQQKQERNYTITAVFDGDNYYPGTKNTTNFQVEQSPTTIDIQNITVNKNNQLNIKATLKDYKGQNLIGTNKILIKINGRSYPVDQKAQYWMIQNGEINLKNIQVNPNITIKRVMIVTGERQAYLGAKNETSKIIKVE